MKLLIMLLIMISCANATTTSFTLPININIPTQCQLSFNVPNINMQLIYNKSSSAQTTLTINCTNGATISLQTTSQNNWYLVGKNTHESLAYSMAYTGSGVFCAYISQVWSGGVADRVVLSGAIQSSSNSLVIPLQITSSIIPPQLENDLFQDQITFTLLF